MNKTFRTIAFLCALGFVLGTAMAWYNEVRDSGASGFSRIEPAAGPGLAGASIGGPFTLVDQDGRTVTDKDYDGLYRLVFFGFSYCPEVCPTELRKMAQVMEALGPLADRVQPIFITTDPERDTPETLKQYVSLFHPRLVGLTGTAEQIKAAEEAYKVYAAKIPGDTPDGYTINHSAYTFFMGPDGAPLSMFAAEDGAAGIAADIRKVLEKGGA